MKFQSFLPLFLVVLACFVLTSHCHTFYVGGKQGWGLHPKQNYNLWSGKQGFHVNDRLIFKYEKGEDSVLLVKKEDYYKCERKHRLMEMRNGSSEFRFTRSGTFYFISGKEGHCSKGQKRMAVVMGPAQSPEHHHRRGHVACPPKGSSSSTAHSPGRHGHVAKPPMGAAQSPYNHHCPISRPPTSVPPGSPMAHGHGPTHSPKPSTHHAPQSPVAHGPTVNPPATSTSPSSSSPQASTPSGSSPPAPPQGVSPSPPSPFVNQTSTPTNGSSPAPSSSSATATYSSGMMIAASVLFSMICI